jgi:hypothetical protein
MDIRYITVRVLARILNRSVSYHHFWRNTINRGQLWQRDIEYSRKYGVWEWQRIACLRY